MATEFSKYKIFWVVLQPAGGKATKADLQVFNRTTLCSMSGNYITAHFPTEERAKSVLKSLKASSGKLTKRYKGFLISDAQFGNSKGDFWSAATSKQKAEAITI